MAKDTLLELEQTLSAEIIQAMLRFCDGCDAANIDGRATAASALNALLTRAYQTASIGGAGHEKIMRVFDQWFSSYGNEHANQRKDDTHASNPN